MFLYQHITVAVQRINAVLLHDDSFCRVQLCYSAT